MRLNAAAEAVEYQGFWGSFWDIIWWVFLAFVFVSYLFVLFAIVADIFRDRALKGGWKALWVICLLLFPVITALVYLIARGGDMAARGQAEASQLRYAQEEYIRTVAARGENSPAEEIARAKHLLEDNIITQSEYETLKAKALA